MRQRLQQVRLRGTGRARQVKDNVTQVIQGCGPALIDNFGRFRSQVFRVEPILPNVLPELPVKGNNFGANSAQACQFFAGGIIQPAQFIKGGAHTGLSLGVSPDRAQGSFGLGQGPVQGNALQGGRQGFPTLGSQGRAAQQFRQHRQLNEANVDETALPQFLAQAQAGVAGWGNYCYRGHQVSLLGIAHKAPQDLPEGWRWRT